MWYRTSYSQLAPKEPLRPDWIDLLETLPDETPERLAGSLPGKYVNKDPMRGAWPSQQPYFNIVNQSNLPKPIASKELIEHHPDPQSIQIGLSLAQQLENNPHFQQMAQQVLAPGTASDFSFINSWDAKSLPANLTPVQKLAIALTKHWKTQNRQLTPYQLALQYAAMHEFGDIMQDEPLTEHFVHQENNAAAKQAHERHSEALQAYLRAQYNATQEWLKQQNITEMPLMRGLVWGSDKLRGAPSYIKQAHDSRPDDVVQHNNVPIHLQPLSSHSVAPKVARYFGRGEPAHRYGAVYHTTVPASHILSVPSTGLGADSQNEVMVLGGKNLVGNMVTSKPVNMPAWGDLQKYFDPEQTANYDAPGSPMAQYPPIYHPEDAPLQKHLIRPPVTRQVAPKKQTVHPVAHPQGQRHLGNSELAAVP